MNVRGITVVVVTLSALLLVGWQAEKPSEKGNVSPGWALDGEDYVWIAPASDPDSWPPLWNHIPKSETDALPAIERECPLGLKVGQSLEEFAALLPPEVFLEFRRPKFSLATGVYVGQPHLDFRSVSLSLVGNRITAASYYLSPYQMPRYDYIFARLQKSLDEHEIVEEKWEAEIPRPPTLRGTQRIGEHHLHVLLTHTIREEPQLQLDQIRIRYSHQELDRMVKEKSFGALYDMTTSEERHENRTWSGDY